MPPSIRAGAFALLAALASFAPAAAADAPAEPSPPAPIAGNPIAAGPIGPWRVAPIHGADVRSVAIHPDDPDLILAGTSAGQLYVSRDGGRGWVEAGPGASLAGWVISDLAFDPDAPERLWAALWGVWGGGMVLISDDLGETWTPRAEGLPGGQVYVLALAGGGRVYAGTRSGVFGSRDGGLSWRPLTAALPEIQKVTSLLLDPTRPGALTAGTWRRAYRSEDGGATWRGVFEGMALDSEVFTLTPVPGRENEVWATTCGWVYRSLDGGLSWRRYQDGLEWRRTPSFAALPSGRLLAGTVGGLYLSDDGGASWRRPGPKMAVLDITWHPARPERAVIAAEGPGVWISDDGGDTLRRTAEGMTNVRIGALARAGSEVLAAVNHAGPVSGIYGSRDGGAGFAHPAPTAAELPPVLSLAVAGPLVLAGTERGLWERAGAEWRRVAELGDRRVEQVATAGGRAVARAADGLWESPGAGARYHPVPYHHGAPLAAALAGEALWVSDAAGLYHLAGGQNHGDEIPVPGGRIEAAGDRLLAWGAGGVYSRALEGGPWTELAKEATAVHPTGDPRRPAVVVTPGGALLAAMVETTAAEAAAGEPTNTVTLQPLRLPVPASSVTSALIAGGRLYVGTSGWGLWVAELSATAPSSSLAPAAPASPVAAAD